MFVVRAFAVWLLIITAESIHGALRQAFVAPVIGDFNSRRIAFFVGLLLIFALASVTARWLAAPDRRALYLAGLLWMVLTACFEIGLGRFVLGLGWERILEDYDVRRGGLMGFGMVFLFLAPTLAAAVRKVRPAR